MKKNITRTLIIFLVIVMMPFPSFAVNEDYIPIHIDGEYDDWDDKPFTEVYPGHNPPASKINYVSLFRDEDNVYVHVLFAYKNNQDITNMTINLYTNMGKENYFLVPDFFWPSDMQSEPDMTLDQSTDLTRLEQVPAEEERSGTESVDQTAPTEQGGTSESTETPAPDNNAPDQGGAPESNDSSEQNILAGHEAVSYILVADNDKTDPAADSATVGDPVPAGSDTTTVTTEEKTNNGQGNGPETTDNTVPDPNTGGADNNNGLGNGPDTNNSQGDGTEPPSSNTSTDSGIGTSPTEGADLSDLLDILDPGNLVDLDSVLDRFVTDGAIDSSPSSDLNDLNSNLNLKKPGWYGTWEFSVWNGYLLVGSGYYTRSEGEPDELELYIPLSSVVQDYDGITEISMRIKKLGPQYIMCSGVSTGAYIGIAAGAGIALLSVGAYTFKRKRPFVLGKGQ